MEKLIEILEWLLLGITAIVGFGCMLSAIAIEITNKIMRYEDENSTRKH